MLKKLIQTKGVKQKWLANKIGVSEVTVSNWVKEKSQPTEKNCLKISEVLNVSLKELMD